MRQQPRAPDSIRLRTGSRGTATAGCPTIRASATPNAEASARRPGQRQSCLQLERVRPQHRPERGDHDGEQPPWQRGTARPRRARTSSAAGASPCRNSSRGRTPSRSRRRRNIASCRNEPRQPVPVRGDRAIHGQQHAVIGAPDHERPRRAMPQPADQHRDHQVAVGLAPCCRDCRRTGCTGSPACRWTARCASAARSRAGSSALYGELKFCGMRSPNR